MPRFIDHPYRSLTAVCELRIYAPSRFTPSNSPRVHRISSFAPPRFGRIVASRAEPRKPARRLERLREIVILFGRGEAAVPENGFRDPDVLGIGEGN
jgi:hypothetical protein